jgi:hypothetical protein
VLRAGGDGGLSGSSLCATLSLAALNSMRAKTLRHMEQGRASSARSKKDRQQVDD